MGDVPEAALTQAAREIRRLEQKLVEAQATIGRLLQERDAAYQECRALSGVLDAAIDDYNALRKRGTP